MVSPLVLVSRSRGGIALVLVASDSIALRASGGIALVLVALLLASRGFVLLNSLPSFVLTLSC